jgi:DMSO reductase family type II enzyme heme b subunit
MRCRRVDDIRKFLSPDSPAWSDGAAQSIPMSPTPLAMQPTEYVRNSWEGKQYGALRALAVASVHDGKRWAIRAGGMRVSRRGGDFPDAFAIALPVRGSPVLALMGSDEAPIHYLRWSASKEGLRSVLATGIGTSRPGPEVHAHAAALSMHDQWQIVIHRPLHAEHPGAGLKAGGKTRIGFAVWHGGNDERAGIKAFSIDWTDMALEA